MKNKLKVFILGIFSLVILTGHGSAENLTGTILETMNSGGYSYVKLKQPEGDVWLAMPQTALEKGATATFQSGMVMKDFEAKSMNRVFDSTRGKIRANLIVACFDRVEIALGYLDGGHFARLQLT